MDIGMLVRKISSLYRFEQKKEKNAIFFLKNAHQQILNHRYWIVLTEEDSGHTGILKM